MKTSKIESIQMFRGLAALIVVIFHFRDVLPFSEDSFIGHYIIRGYSGVDIFFVLSGFIAYYTIESNKKNESLPSLRYLFKRIAKIVPLYFFFTLLSAGHTLDSLYQTIKSFLFIPIGLGREGPIYGGARVGQGWTLNYEMYFYIVASVSFMFGKYKWLFICGFISLMIAIPLMIFPTPVGYGHAGFNFDYAYLSMMSNPITLEFLLGILIGYTYSKMDEKFSLFWLAFAFVSLVYFFMNFYNQFFGFSRLTAWGVPAALLILATLKLEKSNKIKPPLSLIKLGDISFSVYLVHAGVIGLLTKIANNTFNKNNNQFSTTSGLIIFFVAIAITFYLSKLTYAFFELKISHRLRDWLLSRKILSRKIM